MVGSTLNFQQGVYTIAVTAGPGLNTVAATQTILNGQPTQAGSSSLMVTAKQLNSINTVFNNPPNIIASENITWVILYEGDKLGKGNRIAHASSLPSASSGIVPVFFQAGALKEGKMYNVALNPGYTTSTLTAGYVFKYVLQ